MIRFLASILTPILAPVFPVIVVGALVAACQPQTTIQAPLGNDQQDVSGVQSTSVATENDVTWESDLIAPSPTDLNSDELGEPDQTSSVTNTVTNTDTETVETDNQAPKIVPDNNQESTEESATDSMSTIDTLEGAIEQAEQTPAIPAPPIPKPPTVLHPSIVIGNNIEALGNTLGLPDFERSDGDVLIWQYRLAACVTDFFLYLDADEDDYAVTAWAWRAPIIGTMLNAEECTEQLGDLLDANT